MKYMLTDSRQIIKANKTNLALYSSYKKLGNSLVELLEKNDMIMIYNTKLEAYVPHVVTYVSDILIETLDRTLSIEYLNSKIGDIRVVNTVYKRQLDGSLTRYNIDDLF